MEAVGSLIHKELYYAKRKEEIEQERKGGSEIIERFEAACGKGNARDNCGSGISFRSGDTKNVNGHKIETGKEKGLGAGPDIDPAHETAYFAFKRSRISVNNISCGGGGVFAASFVKYPIAILAMINITSATIRNVTISEINCP